MSNQRIIILLYETITWQMLGPRDALFIKSGRNSYTQHVPCQTVMTIWNNWGHTLWQCWGNITPYPPLPFNCWVLLNDHNNTVHNFHCRNGGKKKHLFIIQQHHVFSILRNLHHFCFPKHKVSLPDFANNLTTAFPISLLLSCIWWIHFPKKYFLYCSSSDVDCNLHGQQL